MKTKIASLKEVDTRELDIDDENLPEHFKMHYKLKSPLNMLWYNLVYEFKDNYPAKMNTDFARDMITLYSKKGDTVWDGCSGSGTVPIMAGKLDRRGIGTDVNPKAIELGIEHAVVEKVTHLTSFTVADARTHLVKDVDLILCSLPFGLSIAGDKNNYSDEQGDISNSKDYNEFFSKTQEIIKNYYENLRPLGILILDSRDRTKKGEYHPLSFRFMQQAENVGFKILAIYHYIQVPYRLMPFTHGETEHTMPLVSTMDAIVMYKPVNKTLDGVMQ